jgi:hypothetical protein
MFQGVTTIEASDKSEARARFAEGDWTLEDHEVETDDPPAIYNIGVLNDVDDPPDVAGENG